MSNSKRWFSDLLSTVESSPKLAELAPVTVSFEADGDLFGLDISRRVKIDGAQTQCRLIGNDDIFTRLVSGQTTLQRAHLAGEVELQGDPQSLMRLAFLFEVSASAFGN